MDCTVRAGTRRLRAEAGVVLQHSAQMWFVTVCFGQWWFVAYLLLHYIVPSLRGGPAAWEGHHLATGFVSGDTWGNLAVAAHIYLAAPSIIAGQWQMIPVLRSRFPRLHRMIGYLYLSATVTLASTGFWMVWVRGNPQAGLIEHLGTTTGGILLLVFASLALSAARQRRFAAHHRWAVRLFLTASGVWFIRVAYGWWFLAGGGEPGTFRVFSAVVSYAQYLLPLAGFERYLWAKNHDLPMPKLAAAALIAATTLLMIVGIHQAALRLWLPRLYA